MMWRAGLVRSTDLHGGSNADDAQIATAVRLAGRRSIQDHEAWFVDIPPLTLRGQQRQKIRRAQGLQRHLLRHRRFWFSLHLGRFATVLRREAHFHLSAPLLIVAAGGLAVVRWIQTILVGVPSETDALLHGILSVIEVYGLIAWWLMRTGVKVRGMRTVGTHLVGFEHLLKALWTSATGRSLHLWDQHTDVRKRMAELRGNSSEKDPGSA